MENVVWIAFLTFLKIHMQIQRNRSEDLVMYCVFCGCVLDGLVMQNLPLLGPRDLTETFMCSTNVHENAKRQKQCVQNVLQEREIRQDCF